MATFFIYGLLDSEFPDEIRYVGQTKSLVNRLRDHVCTAGTFGPRGFWSWGVSFWGRSIEMALLDAVSGCRQDALAAESCHVNRLHSAGCRLLNMPQYQQRCESFGVSESLIKSYFDGLRMLEKGWEMRPTKDVKELLFWGSTAVDALESSFPAMSLWGPKDSFRSRWWEKFPIRHCKAS